MSPIPIVGAPFAIAMGFEDIREGNFLVGGLSIVGGALPVIEEAVAVARAARATGTALQSIETASREVASEVAELAPSVESASSIKGQRLLANKAKGDAFRDELAALFAKDPSNEVLTEVSFRTDLGYRRYDVALYKRVGGGVAEDPYLLIEAKVGGSRYLRSQRMKDALIMKAQNIPVILVRKP
jgi:hypothetical protein